MGNDAADLTAYLESVTRFADAVVALDAGCSDGTRAILEAHPLVRRVLPASPRSQPTDDLGRLADAARELGARWVIALDADERLAPDDAAVLRRFVADEADVELAYAVRRHRMVDPMHYDDARTVGRLFAPRSGDHFAPDDRDGSRLPTRLAAGRVCNTTIRLQWFDRSAGDAQRGHPWIARSPLLPPVANGPCIDDRPLAADEPALSVVVISQDDESRIGSALDAILAQDIDEPFEVIVVNSGTDRTVDIVRTHYPDVVVVAFDRAALPGEARNAGWRAARGRFVSFPGSHVEITPGSLAARLATHRRGWPMVAGAMANGTFTCAVWPATSSTTAPCCPGARPSCSTRPH
jgi:glycosyltransferase involved in cell wall biosynthesis